MVIGRWWLSECYRSDNNCYCNCYRYCADHNNELSSNLLRKCPNAVLLSVNIHECWSSQCPKVNCNVQLEPQTTGVKFASFAIKDLMTIHCTTRLIYDYCVILFQSMKRHGFSTVQIRMMMTKCPNLKHWYYWSVFSDLFTVL